ncbi:DNA phosphorothioation system sulfurtransferase DndC [Capnocytophaga canimorsus]|uniref:DNA phosphorothioation system sulfurtransferase DndC n=1 Tax=Capnocytophaga canimorsus TaxID=28188 RepID=UPI000D6E1D40|nr:DNA phosphorothioation system sulfurtransferase DndC [Capnocytophaga canimorsus]AWL79415.1 DNA phosphorothioation system sulfurtransferase DndC [Capnocytophaga canimorsus]AYW35992.1 DNA phosphorothioation system sulfurtransferase DndC [Capnocytophaga canimorsus]
MSKRINYIIEEIADQYTIEDNDRPWIIGFSGGKDSTVLLTLTWLALLKIKNEQGQKYLTREVYVVCNDTLVENPIITNYVNKVLKKIEDASLTHNLPIKVRKTIPRLEDSFWVNLIGKGYPAPNNAFRWCTERLKIKPTSRFVSEIIKSDENNHREAIILVGTRKSESSTRAKSIKKHEIRGKRLTKHPLQNNVFVYSPIKELELEEVWYIINTFKSPWGADNKELFDIYMDASADDYECPTMVSNDEHKSCGQSRFGCWTCTVVKQDKSISAQIENGKKWLVPLRDLRNWIQEERNKPENRSHLRRDGSSAAIPHGGVVEMKHRAEILEKVFEVQKTINNLGYEIELINKQELIAIQVIWYRDLYFEFTVSDIYNKIFNKHLDMKQHNELVKKEEELLLSACKDDKKQFKLIQDLLKLEKAKTIMVKRRGLLEDIEKRFKQHISA